MRYKVPVLSPCSACKSHTKLFPTTYKEHKVSCEERLVGELTVCGIRMPSSASHWKSATDPRTGRTYYYHELTRETQWRKPLELASSDEKRAMEEKERKQKDFFAAMEANILSSMSQGVVPGTPKHPTVGRQRSKQPPVTNNRGPRPELVRTISAMDESALKDIIKRQPSFRNVSQKHSLSPGDLEKSNHEGDGDFSSLSNMPLDPLAESTREFDNHDSTIDNLFDELPNENPDSDQDSVEIEIGGITPLGMKSGKSTTSKGSYGGKLNESSISGFGLTWEETKALKKLAEITKEMVDSEHEPTRNFGTPFVSRGSTNKGQKDLPRELDFGEDSESSRGDDDLSPTPAFKGKGQAPRALPRELDFDDSDSETESSGLGPTPDKPKAKQSVVRIAEDAKKPKSVKSDDSVRPLTRRNTCGTMYVGTTMSAPDKEATIKVRPIPWLVCYLFIASS